MGPRTTQVYRLIKRYDQAAKLVSDGREIVCVCPFCLGVKGHKQKLYTNPIKGVFLCYRCDKRGSVSWLIQVLKRRYPDKFVGVDLSILESPIEQVEVAHEVKELSLPDEYLPILGSKDRVGLRAHAYLAERGITDDLIELYRLGYAFQGKFAYRVIVPTYEDGRLVYYLGRDFTGALEKKVLNPSKEQVGTGSKDYVFGFDLARQFGEAVITEGVFDAMSVRPPIGPIGSGVALFGKTMSLTQHHKIRQAKLRLTLMLDADASSQLFSLAEAFIHVGPIRLALLPQGDPNSMRDRLSEVTVVDVQNEDDLSVLKLRSKLHSSR